jgi:flagellar protein FliO/FliZ
MQAITFVFAFVAVLALIGAAAWLVRRFAGNRLGANANRGRMPRLAVIDAAAVDGRRRLVLVRRDNVEHLLMIGGPTDIVVEPNIVRASPARDQMQQRANVGTELPRIPQLSDPGTWPEGDGNLDHPEPQLPELPSRPVRPAFADEGRRPAPVALSERRSESAERRADPMGRVDSSDRRADSAGRADSIAGFAPEPLQRPEPRPEPRVVEPPPRIARSEPPLMPRTPLRPVEPPARMPPIRVQERAAAPLVPPAPPPLPGPSISADQNLADMAQRLEAALRRPPGETRSDATEPRLAAIPVAPEPPPTIRPALRSSNEGSNGGAARNEAPAAAPAPTPKSGFENLEDEMASLLGRPKSSSS